MSKELAVTGCTLIPVPPATGTITITSTASTQVLAAGKGVYFKEIKFKVTNSNGGGPVTNNDGKGEGAIIASGSNILDGSGNKAVLKDDESGSVKINGTKPSGSGSTPASGQIKVRVSVAGQTDVIAL